jgi:carbamoyl-phosphate synthase large subunit
MLALAKAFDGGMTVDEVHALTRIDHWFLHQIAEVVAFRRELLSPESTLDAATLSRAKRLGYSDKGIGAVVGETEHTVRTLRKRHGVEARVCQIDTLAAEYPAETNYLYLSHHGDADDVAPSWRKKVLVLGGGAYRIGSSVEFDWCCVNTVRALQEMGYETILLNYNPETVSTDYDVCDKLFFDEISFETVLDIWERERPLGVVVSMGGQVPNNLALKLHRAGVKVLGTSPDNIDRAEDRKKFSALLDELAQAQNLEAKERVLMKMHTTTTAQEQRWLLRIILKDMHIGMKEDSILTMLHADAKELYNSVCDLHQTCIKCADPSYRLDQISVVRGCLLP